MSSTNVKSERYVSFNREQQEYIDVLRGQLAAAQEDTKRLDWILHTITTIGLDGFRMKVNWGYPALEREDIDNAMEGQDDVE